MPGIVAVRQIAHVLEREFVGFLWADQAIEAVRDADDFPLMFEKRGLHHGADDSIEARRITAAGADSDATDIGHCTVMVKAAAAITNPPGTATITATSGTLSATSTITVNTGPLTTIVISTTTPNPAAGQTVTFTALGTFSGSSQQQDITDLVVWTSTNSAVITTITNGSGAVLSTATSGATTSVSASLDGITSGALTITVQ